MAPTAREGNLSSPPGVGPHGSMLAQPRYAPRRVSNLVACPFCRELFTRGESTHCPACGLALTDLAKLPPSADALAIEDDFGIPTQPHLETLPATYLRRGRGALLALGVLGLAAFFLPWIHMSVPDVRVMTGFDLARRTGFTWSVAVAWFVLLPMVLTRRSIDKMRGARVAAAFLSAVPVVTTSILLASPPHSRYYPVVFHWGAGLYASLALGIAATIVSVRFGGAIDDVTVARGKVAGSGATLH
jgi:hypothetical protein